MGDLREAVGREVERLHAERYPDGCGPTWGSSCEACCARLGGAKARCHETFNPDCRTCEEIGPGPHCVACGNPLIPGLNDSFCSQACSGATCHTCAHPLVVELESLPAVRGASVIACLCCFYNHELPLDSEAR